MREKIVMVEWVDITSEPGWFPKDAHHSDLARPLRCQSVGFLIAQTKDNVHLAETFAASPNGHDERYGGQTVIPRGCIKKIRRLHL